MCVCVQAFVFGTVPPCACSALQTLRPPASRRPDRCFVVAPPPALVSMSLSSASVAESAAARKTRKRGRTTEPAINSAMDTMEQEALDELVALLQQDPRKIFPTLRWAQSSAVAARAEPPPPPPADDENEWDFHDSYRKLYRVPKDFLRQFLPPLPEMALRLKSEALTRLEKSEDGTVRNLFVWACNVSTDTAWPPFCHKKRIFREVFTNAVVDRGNRLSGIVTKEVGEKLFADWTKCGGYVFGPAGGNKEWVDHVPTKTCAQLAECGFEGEFDVQNNSHELKVELRVRRQVTRITEFFEEAFVSSLKASHAKTRAYLQEKANTARAKLDDGEEGEEEPTSNSGSGSNRRPSPAKPAPQKKPSATTAKQTPRRAGKK